MFVLIFQLVNIALCAAVVFMPGVALENVLLVVVLSVISLLVPMAKIGRIQPVSIINNRD